MYLTFGEWLRERRKAAGLKQEAMGERVGLTQAQVSRLESGLQKATADVARSLFDVLNVSPEEASYWLERLEPVRAPTRSTIPLPRTPGRLPPERYPSC